jgi:hypothetical protein
VHGPADLLRHSLMNKTRGSIHASQS